MDTSALPVPILFAKPFISTSTAHLIGLGVGSIYVGSIYLSKNARLSFRKVITPEATTSSIGSGYSEGSSVYSNGSGASETGEREKLKDERWRDDPDVIRARLAAVSVATGICCTGVLGVVFWGLGGAVKDLGLALDDTLVRLGIRQFASNAFSGILDLQSYKAHIVTPILFLGPLFGSFLSGELPFQRNWSFRNHVVKRFFGIQGIRNYWVAPITEELVFRACVLSIYHLSGASQKRMIYLAPLTFGLAHAHHAWETYNRYGRTSQALKRAAIGTLFQLSYTTLFGMHVSFLFLRTGSIWPSITSHIFCNTMGIPEIGYELRRFQKWKWAIIATYLIGIAGFTYTLTRWTLNPGNFYWPTPGDIRFATVKY